MRVHPACLVAAATMACSATAAASLELRTQWLEKCTGEPASSVYGFDDDWLPPKDSQPASAGGALKPAAVGLSPGTLIAATVVNAITGKLEEQAAAQESVPIQSPAVISRFYVLSETGELLPRKKTGCLAVVLGEAVRPLEPGQLIPEDGLSVHESDFEPHLRFEMRLVRDVAAKVQRLVPRYLKVHRFQLEGWFRRDRTLSFSVNLSGVLAEKAFATATFTFTGIELGQEIGSGDARLLAAAGPLIELHPELADAKSVSSAQRAFVAPAIRAKALIAGPATKTPYEAESEKPLNRYRTTRKAGDSNSPAEGYCEALATRNAAVGPAFAKHDEQCYPLFEQAQQRAELDLEVFAKGPAARLCAAVRETVNRTDCLPGFKPDLFGPALPEGRVTRTTGFFVHSASVKEARPKSLFGTAVAKAFSDNAEALTTKLADKFSTSKQRELDEAEAAKGRKERRDVLLADQGVQLAQLHYDAALSAGNSEAGVLEKSVALIKAKIAANDAYRAAGMAPPFPEYD